MFLSYREEDVSGNFTPLYVRNPSDPSLQPSGVPRTHPSDQSAEFQDFGDFGINPFRHSHTGDLLILQLVYALQVA
jgi:hypothetical protein